MTFIRVFLRIFYKRREQISINTVLSTEKEVEGGGWKNKSQWSRFSGIKGESSLFSAYTISREWFESRESMVENDAHCFCGETVSDMRRFSETDDYANRENDFLSAVLLTERETNEKRGSHAKYRKNMQIKSRTGRIDG